MLLGLWAARDIKQVRGVMVAGSSVLVALSVLLTVQFINLRAGGNTDEMLFVSSMPWFKSLNISYAIGVDGISVVMLLLSSIIVFTGTFASWKLQPLTKEFFMWFVLLSTGVFGFFICIDLFAMFMFYEVALIPMYLLIGYWGSGKKEYAAMKLTLMLMGGSALIILGLVGIYFFNGASTMNILEIRIRCARCSVPIPHMVSYRSRLCPNLSVNAPRWCIDEARWLRLLPYRYVPAPRCSGDMGSSVPNPHHYLCGLWCILCLCSD